jgi:hypothetical protein
MARVADDAAADGGEDWVATVYFPMFSVNNKMDNTNNGARTEVSPWTSQAYPYLMLERVGDNFYGRVSSNGTTWLGLNNVSPITRSDMSGLPLQVGIWQCTYINTTGYMAFDDFQLDMQMAFIEPLYPKDNATGVPVESDLTWRVNGGVVAFDVYFGDNILSVAGESRFEGDVNGDDKVDFSDIEAFACQWLMAPPSGPARSSDLNDDGDVDFSDFALIAENFGAVGDGVYKGHFKVGTDTFEPGTLSAATEYYWRIDGIDSEGNTVRGPVYKFTTQ